jgi:hypothetical protein
MGVASAVTGAVVASRLPGNAVGWLILGLGVGVGVILACGSYAELGASGRGPSTGVPAAAWIGSTGGIPVFFGLTGYLLLLFPTGHLLSPRWRYWAWFFGAIVVVATLSYGLLPGEVAPGVENPLAVPDRWVPLTRAAADVTDVMALPGMGSTVVALLLRLRRSRGVERQQLKWFAFVALAACLGMGLTVITSGALADASFLLGLIGVAALPVTAGLAILRQGLYGIDVVIKRTLVYAPLAAALVVTYLGLVLAMQALLPIEAENDLLVAVSTLAVAALFRPLRNRMRDVVDRRFYRSRYDAGRTLETFGTRLRDQVDIDALGGDLRGVVRDTMQPAHVSLWLRETPR